MLFTWATVAACLYPNNFDRNSTWMSGHHIISMSIESSFFACSNSTHV
jgi:hypothetical protein